MRLKMDEKERSRREKISQSMKGRIFTKEHKRNISLAKKGKPNGCKGRIAPNKGIPMSEEAKRKQRLLNSGKNNAQWIDGRSLKPYPRIFRKIRKFIYKRDNFTCQLCKIEFERTYKSGDKNFITAHHIDYNTQNNDLNNLIALCNFCNVSVNRNRKEWIKLFQDKIKRMES